MTYALFCDKCGLGSFCNEKIDSFICNTCKNNQPERSKREDSITYLDDIDKTDAYQAVRALGEIVRKSRGMRCSELYGDIET